MRSLLMLSLASAALLSATSLGAQPEPRDHRHVDIRDHHPMGGPHEAPPPPREEKFEARKGYLWISGRWDWRDGKWAWQAGRWEREHAGKHWQAGHWDKNGEAFVFTDGVWVDGELVAAAPPPPPPPGAMGAIGAVPAVHEHHEWKLDRPTVSSYWPTKGKPGTKIVIHGRNFPPDATVMWGADAVHGAKVESDKIIVEVPPTATSGTIAIHREHGRDLVVGNFDVAAGFDPEADARKQEDERRRVAEAEWAASQGALAKDRAARLAAEQKAEQDREANREQRRADRVAAIRAKWEQAFLADADTQAELTLHAQRVADLERMKDVAQIESNSKLGVRIDIATTRETQRHDQRMAALHDAFKTKGGAP